MDLKIRGRSALITGASKGIGFAIAMVLADEGCDLILVSRTAADLDAAKEKLRKTGVSVQVHPLDVSSSASIEKLVAEHPGIDIVINNAGAIPAGAVGRFTCGGLCHAAPAGIARRPGRTRVALAAPI